MTTYVGQPITAWRNCLKDSQWSIEKDSSPALEAGSNCKKFI